jgi:hypothetical protein
MTERLKLRHKVTCEEKGPYWGFLPNTWFKLFATGEYDYIRSSDCYDKHGNENLCRRHGQLLGWVACPDRGND